MSHQGGIDKSFPIPANDQYIKPIAERARELAGEIALLYGNRLHRLAELVAELAEKLEPAEVRKK